MKEYETLMQNTFKLWDTIDKLIVVAANPIIKENYQIVNNNDIVILTNKNKGVII